MILNKDQLLLDAEYWFPFTEYQDLKDIEKLMQADGSWFHKLENVYGPWGNENESWDMLAAKYISWLALFIREAME